MRIKKVEVMLYKWGRLLCSPLTKEEIKKPEINVNGGPWTNFSVKVASAITVNYSFSRAEMTEDLNKYDPKGKRLSSAQLVTLPLLFQLLWNHCELHLFSRLNSEYWQKWIFLSTRIPQQSGEIRIWKNSSVWNWSFKGSGRNFKGHICIQGAYLSDI